MKGNWSRPVSRSRCLCHQSASNFTSNDNQCKQEIETHKQIGCTLAFGHKWLLRSACRLLEAISQAWPSFTQTKD
eukprot:scaffold3464_cov268-Skeletonema_menzelii.AAC.1